jgi:hypothetical protein
MENREDYIFRGWIQYFGRNPGGLAVDWFEYKHNLYFLSHAHRDHFSFKDDGEYFGLLEPDFIKGLKKRPHAKIYCTEITQNIIRNLHDATDDLIDELEKHFVVLEPYETREIRFMDSRGNLTEDRMNVTTIPANHIPGAVMFLFDDGKKRALYTGDFRYDVREENSEMETLKKFVEDYKDVMIDYLYVDITCLDIGKLYHPDQNKLPTRQESKDMVCKLIEEMKPKNVHIDADLLGAEDMVKAVARFSNNTAEEILSRLEVDCPKKQLYEYTLKGLGKPTIDSTPRKTNVSIFHKAIFDDKRRRHCDHETMKVRATLMRIFRNEEYSYSNRKTWKNYSSEHGGYWQILYSHHSSDAEIRGFLSRLQYKEVIPISKPIRRYLEGVSYSDHEHSNIRRSLYSSLDESDWRPKVLWFLRDSCDLRVGGEFEVTVKCFNSYDEVVLNVHQNVNTNIKYHFIIVPCPRENRIDMNRLIYDIIRKLRRRGTYLLFYSTTDNFSNIWQREIESFTNDDVFYINLSKVKEYIESENQIYLGTQILMETMKNLNRNREKVVLARDWPMPYEFSERRKEYEIESQRHAKPESQEVEMKDNENISNEVDNAEEGLQKKEEPLSQEVEMIEPQIK